METYNSRMPTTYSSGMPADEQLTDNQFVKSIPGILKIVEMAFTITTFICAAADPSFLGQGGGWVVFVSLTSFTEITVLFVLYLFFVMPRIEARMPAKMPWKLFEFILYAVISVFFFIAAVVAAVWAGRSTHSASAACAFFAFATWLICGGDAVLQMRVWRSSLQANSGAAQAGGANQAVAPPTVSNPNVPSPSAAEQGRGASAAPDDRKMPVY